MLPPMLSYAQNAEDVVLRRVFAGKTTGRYVDIGACTPVEDSVTLHFYEAGWTGVNVEPDPRFHAQLVEQRERDVNLQAAVGTGEGTARFYPTALRGQGTLDTGLAAERGEQDPVEVPQLTLDEVFREHCPDGLVDFLKVDVEGWERDVLASADLRRVRPRVVVVEAVDADGTPTHEQWESLLLDAGYRFGLFDGLNRFYCRKEEADELLAALAAPANVLDNYRLAREVQVQERLATQLERVQQHADGLSAEVETLRARLAAVEREREEQASRLLAERDGALRERDVLSAERDELRREHQQVVRVAQDRERAAAQRELDLTGQLDRERAALVQARQDLEAERTAHALVRGELEGVYTSTSWRVTRPVRNASRLAKLVTPGPVA